MGIAARRSALGAAILALVALTAQTGSGQIRNNTVEKGVKVEEKFTDAVTLPRNPASKQLIQAAQDYIKKKEWQVAAEALQSLLETPDDSFIEVKRKVNGRDVDAKVSVREEANRLIGELPPDGLESYRVRYGPTAHDRLKEAQEKADAMLLAEVSQRYFHTEAGAKATQMLGAYHLDRGHNLMASLCFERLLNKPDADKLSPQVQFKAALAYRRAGNVAASDKLMAKVADRVGSTGHLDFGRSRLTLAQLTAELGREVASDSAPGLFDWPLYRGNATRTAMGVGGTAYLQPRWSASLIEHDETSESKDKPTVEWIKEHLDTAFRQLKDRPILPAFFPVAAPGKLIVRDYDGVTAYDVIASPNGEGKDFRFSWRSRADNSLFATVFNDNGGKRMALEQWYNNYRSSNLHVGVFFENSLLGTISHDGRRVYFIDDLAVPPPPQMAQMANFGPGTMNYGPFADEVQYNRLCAANLSDGRLSWFLLGGKAAPGKSKDAAKDDKKDITSAADLTDTFFLGPPLPLGGKLYVLVEKNSEIRLICLDPEKIESPPNSNEKYPELVWAQSLGTANVKLSQDSLRRLHAANLAYADGILVCPTNAGAVVGVDLLSHSLVWAFSYRKAVGVNSDEPMFRPGRRFVGNFSQPGGERWRASAPCIVKGKVVFTAHDGNEIFCLNLRDGQMLWKASRDEANDLYLAAVNDDRVLVVGKTSVRALNLDTGREVWKRTDTGMPSGQGVAAGGLYYLPLATSSDPKSADKGAEVCALDIKTGAPVSRTKSRDDAPGNLLFMNGELISQTPSAVTSYPLLQVKQDEISRSLAKNPNDPRGLFERGQLHLYNGEVRAAVADLRNSLSHEPDAPTRTKARAKLHESLTSLLQKDFAAGEPYLAEFEDLANIDIPESASPEKKQELRAEQTRRQAVYLELLGRGREKQGRVLDAFAAYERFGELSGHKELIESVEEPGTRTRPDIWSRGRIQALLAAAKPEDRQLLDAEIARRWEAVRNGESLDGLRRFVSLYGSITAAGTSARLELAGRLIHTGDPDDLTEAERLLGVLCYSSLHRRQDPAAGARAVDMMVTVCVRRGQFENAVGFYRQLGEEFADVVVRDGLTGRQLFDELITDKRFAPYVDTPTAVWPGPLSAREQEGMFPPGRDTSLTLEPHGELLPVFQRNRIVLEPRSDGSGHWWLKLIDRATGEERWRVPNLLASPNPYNSQNIQPFAFARGQQLIVQINGVVHAFDLNERRKVWDYQLLKDQNPAHPYMLGPDGMTVVTPDQRSFNVGRVALAEASYVCLQTREGLVVVDPERPGPSVMWVKGGVSPKAQVFGDDAHVFVVDAEAGAGKPKCLALRSQDGAVEPGVPDFSQQFARKIGQVGRRLLIRDSGGKSVALFDPLSGKEVWRREFAERSVLAQDVPGLLAVVEPGGLFTLLNAATGELKFTSRFEPEHVEKLQEVTLLVDRDHYFVALNQAADAGLSWSTATLGSGLVKVNGSVYALSRRTGKKEWSCDFLQHQYLLTEQLADMPVLVFASSYNRSSANQTPERQAVKVTAVVKSSGKLLYDKDLPQSSPFFAMRCKPAEGRIELERSDRRIIFLTRDAASLPEPTSPRPTRVPAAGRIVPLPAAARPVIMPAN